MSLLNALCVFLLLIALTNSQSIDASINQADGVVITGISGCETVSSTQTINCGRPVTLTITGSGFLNGLPSQSWPSFYMSFSVLVPDSQATYPCVVGSANVSDTQFECAISDQGFGRMITETLLDVQYVNQLTKEQATFRQAISFAHETAPRVDRVSGCPFVSSDGRSVTQCSLVNDQITLHGSGFLSVDHSYGIVSLGSASQPLYLAYDNLLIVRYSDDQIVFNFGSAAAFITGIDTEPGKALALTMRDGTESGLWYTEPVHVTFTNVPDPVIRMVMQGSNVQSCNLDNSTGVTRFRDCVPGLSSLWVQGEYMFPPVTVTVGGVTARIVQGTAISLVFYVPVFGSVDGVYYDITVTTPAGSTTVPSMIAFSHDPLIYEVVPCIDSGDNALVAAHCRPTETLQLKVMNIRQTSTPRIVFTSVWSTNMSVDCPNVRIVDRATITCVMPDYPTDWPEVPLVMIRLEWPDQSKTADVTVSPLWDPVDAPRITSLSGCFSDSNDPLHLNQCLGQSVNGVLLTIHGVRLGPAASGQPWTVNIGYQLCYNPAIVDNQTVVCLLPDLAAPDSAWLQLTYGVKYALVMQRFDTVFKSSNAGYVTFVQQETRSSSSSTSASTIALATVFSIVGAVLIAGCIFMMYRQARSKRRASSDMAPEFSSTGNHVELEQV